MKKKYFFKKLMSVILAAVTMFSLLTLPAHAIIPGEDAYITTTTLTRYYCDTGTTQTIVVSNDDNMYNEDGSSTHDFLSDEELDRCVRRTGDVSTQVIIGEDNRIVISTDPVWKMTVLILQGIDTNGDNLADEYFVGSGFLVADNVMVTAMHCLYPFGVSENFESGNILPAIVYHGVSSSQSSTSISSLVAGADSAHIESITYDARYFTSLESEEYSSAYDWCVVTLDEEFESYYLDCDIAISSIEGEIVGVAGYPQDINGEYQFQRKIGLGEVTSNDGIILIHDADTKIGESGGPLMTNVLTGELVGYGIHVGGHSRADGTGIENYARAITPAIYNAIVTIILDS